mmetsp:Transcript_30491/g.61067  ORF Transcript_30491/g.61067 Transcript_30491/m.61067 type:complete len:165 (+) Transcript_30491:144-638(+)
MSAGQMAAKEASKAAQREKEQAAFAKKQGRKDKEWAVGAKDTSKLDAQSAAELDATAKKTEKRAIEAAEGGPTVGGGGPLMKTCKDCKKKYNANSKKGCQNCIDLLFGAATAKPKKKEVGGPLGRASFFRIKNKLVAGCRNTISKNNIIFEYEVQDFENWSILI